MDLDVVPDPERGNLTRLARALSELHAVPAEGDEFASTEFPMDASDVDDLAGGGNFRLETDLGHLTSCSGSRASKSTTSTPSLTPPR